MPGILIVWKSFFATKTDDGIRASNTFAFRDRESRLDGKISLDGCWSELEAMAACLTSDLFDDFAFLGFVRLSFFAIVCT